MPVIGTRQSPIALRTAEALPLARPAKLMRVDYTEQHKFRGTFKKVGTDHPILEIDAKNRRGSVWFRGIDWKLAQIHIHTSSEHFVDSDVSGDFEIHLVHVPVPPLKPGRGGGPHTNTIVYPEAPPKLVIGILYERGDENAADDRFAEFVSQLAKGTAGHESDDGEHHPSGDGTTGPTVSVYPWRFFPRRPQGGADLTQWFHYEGSLTGPPYSEDVSWFVMRDPAVISLESLKGLGRYAAQHAREQQAIDRRLVVRSFLDARVDND